MAEEEKKDGTTELEAGTQTEDNSNSEPGNIEENNNPGEVQENLSTRSTVPAGGSTVAGTPTARPTIAPAVILRTRTPEDRIKWLNILDHGESGSGKTNFAGSMVQSGIKTLYLTFSEDEMMTLDRAGITGFDYIVIDNYEKQLWPIYIALRNNSKHYDGVVID